MTTKLEMACTFVKEMKELFGGEYEFWDVSTHQVSVYEVTSRKRYLIGLDFYEVDQRAGVRVAKGCYTVFYSGQFEDEIEYDDGLVGDFLNIEPHEYGLLKLKYGVDKEDLYIPSFARGWVKL